MPISLPISMRGRTQSSSSEPPGPSGGLQKDHYRIIMMGAASVGKTCIISQFLYEEFISKYKATVEELHQGEYEINSKPLTLDILDTTGSYEFPAMRQLSITTGDAFILVYSVDDEASFEEVKNLRLKIIEQKDNDLIPIVIVANKIDVAQDKRVVMRETIEPTVNIDWGNGYVEASAKDNINIVAIFKELLAQAKVQFELSPAVRRRRKSLPMSSLSNKKDRKESCVIS